MNKDLEKNDPICELMQKADRETVIDLQAASARVHSIRSSRERRTLLVAIALPCFAALAIAIGFSMNRTDNRTDDLEPGLRIAISAVEKESPRPEDESSLSNEDLQQKLAQLRREKRQLELIELRIEAAQRTRQAEMSVERSALLADLSRDVTVPDLTELGF